MKDASGKAFRIGPDDKYVVVVNSRIQLTQEEIQQLHDDLHKWYFSPSKFFVLNFPDAIDLEFEKAEKSD